MIEAGRSNLLDITISCDRRLNIPPQHSHCGRCSSCITRRNVFYALGLPQRRRDFHNDLLTEVNLVPQHKEMLKLMLGEMKVFLHQNLDGFCRLWKDDILPVQEKIQYDDVYYPAAERIYDLCRRHYRRCGRP